MPAFKDQAAVDLVGKPHNVAIADGGGAIEYVLLIEHAAGGVVRRVEYDQPGAVADFVGEFVDVEPKIFFFAQMHGHWLSTQETDQRFVDRESGVGINDLIA